MWSFLNPAFLIAVSAAAIPLVLHLLQRRRTVKIPFSTIRFLKLAQKRSASRVRLENLLLWFLRTLILLLLALAFALPVLRTTSFGNLLGMSHRDVAIVWDVSYSMTYESGRTKLWDDARDTVSAIVHGLQSGDRVCIFLAANDVTPLLAQPTGDHDLALSLIKAQGPHNTASHLRPAVGAALDALKESGNRERELYIVTDGQALPWSKFADEAGKLTPPPTFVALLGPKSPQNTAPQGVEIQPALLLTNTAAKVTAKLLRAGDKTETTVALFVDDQEVNRRSATGSAEFSLPQLPVGIHTARVETPADPIAIDNAFHFLLRVRERLPVLLVGTTMDAFFLTRALNPTGSFIDVKRIDPDALAAESLGDYSCLLFANAIPLPGQALLNVENFVQRGGTLVLFPGDRATAADYASWSCLPAKPTAIEDAATPARHSIRLLNPRDPLFNALKLPPGSVPAITVRRSLALETTPHLDPLPVDGERKPDSLSLPKGEGQGEGSAEPILSLGDSQPLLLARTFDKGRVLLFTVSADRRWSDLPLSPIFLPIVHQIVQFGAGVTTEKLFEWGTEPGIHHDPDSAINIPREESDVTPVNPDELPLPAARIAHDRTELLHQIEEHRVGRPLAETLLWLAFALALLELFLANRAARPTATTKRGPPIPEGRTPSRPHVSATA